MTWSNWAGNQVCAPRNFVSPRDESDVINAVRQFATGSNVIRVAGSGHSFTPLVSSDAVIVDVRQLSGLVRVDVACRRAVVRAGTTIRDLGDLLWQHGLSLINQGDIAAQTIAGAVSTGTKGSGVAFGSMSSQVAGGRVVDGAGAIEEISESDGDALRAFQVSLGLLGIITELELEVAPAYLLAEHNRVASLEEVLDSWDDAAEAHRHFSFFWAPDAHSSAMYDLPAIPPDHCYIKTLSEYAATDTDVEDPSVTGRPGDRRGPSHLIFPDLESQPAGHVETELMVSKRDGREAFLAVRNLIQQGFVAESSPVQVRWQRNDEAFLSAGYQRDSVSISVSSGNDGNYSPLLRAVGEELQQFDARPHWGKVHYLGPHDVERLYPALSRFRDIRERFDPAGVFVNDYLRDLLAVCPVSSDSSHRS